MLEAIPSTTICRFNFVDDKIPFFGNLCQSSFWSLFLGFVHFLGVFFLCRINLDNCVLLVSFVDLLKTKFTISLSEFCVDHRFLLLEMNIFLFQRIFFCWVYRGIYQIYWPSQHFSCQQKSPIIPPPDSTFFWRGPKPQFSRSRFIVSTSNNKNPVREWGLAKATNRPIFLKLLRLRKNCQSLRRINKSSQSKRSEPGKAFCSSLKKRGRSFGQSHLNSSWGRDYGTTLKQSIIFNQTLTAKFTNSNKHKSLWSDESSIAKSETYYYS